MLRYILQKKWYQSVTKLINIIEPSHRRITTNYFIWLRLRINSLCLLLSSVEPAVHVERVNMCFSPRLWCQLFYKDVHVIIQKNFRSKIESKTFFQTTNSMPSIFHYAGTLCSGNNFIVIPLTLTVGWRLIQHKHDEKVITTINQYYNRSMNCCIVSV